MEPSQAGWYWCTLASQQAGVRLTVLQWQVEGQVEQQVEGQVEEQVEEGQQEVVQEVGTTTKPPPGEILI